MPKYKRQLRAKNEKPSLINQEFGHFKQFTSDSDPGWIEVFLGDLETDGYIHLKKFSETIGRVKNMDVSDYRKDVAKMKKETPVLEAKRNLLANLKLHVDSAKEKVNEVYNHILRVTEPEPISDTGKAMLRELRYLHIAERIEKTDPRTRHDVIRMGGKLYLEALVATQDIYAAFPLISPENLLKFRREYAFSNTDEGLQEWERDTQTIYESIRRRAGEIYSTSMMMGIVEAKIDIDVAPLEFYSVFPPQSDHEMELAERRVQTYEREQANIAMKKQMEEKQRLSDSLAPLNPNLGKTRERIERTSQKRV